MIVIIHGDNKVKAQDIVIQIKKTLDIKIPDTNLLANKKEFEITDISPEQLQNEIGSFGLFEDAPFIILNITRTGKMNIDSYIQVLQKTPDEVVVILISSKELPTTNKFLKNCKTLKAKILLNNDVPSSNIFNLVDAIFDKNKIKAYKEYRNLSLDKDKDDIYILAMINYGLRNICYIKFASKEANKLNPYIRNKLIKQSKNFTQMQLKENYKLIKDIDLKVKTGQISKEISIPFVIEKMIGF